MENELKELLKRAKKPLSFDKIVEKLGIDSDVKKQELISSLEKGLNDYNIYKTPNDNYTLMEKTSFRVGRFNGSRNDAKVIVSSVFTNKEGKKFYKNDCYLVNTKNIGGAIDGDLVLVNLYSDHKNDPLKAQVRDVIERNLNHIVGEIYGLGGKYFVKPIDKKKQGLTIALEGEAIEGQRVAVNLGKKVEESVYTGTIERVFNHKDDPGEDILWEAFKCGIDDKFSTESIKQVENIPTSVRDIDKIGRMDLTDWEIFTIDGSDTKDIDDALSCKILENGNYLIGVHIADVSNYVPYNSPLDKDAFKRGTSVYLGGKVIPMLPHKLSNGICSLNPMVERLAISCLMEVTSNGEVVNHSINKSVIKSNIKMTYEEVNKIFKKQEFDSEYKDYVDSLRNLNKLALVLRKKRIENGAIEFLNTELKIKNDDMGNVCDIAVSTQDMAENLIEEFMLLANETVDKHLENLGIEALHRVHDVPNMEKMEEFFRLLTALGYNYDSFSFDDCCNYPKALQNLEEFIRSTGKLSSALSTNLIQCMSRAKYSPDNIGHFGLAKDNYCHFTSPIRRYPDLTIHRLLTDEVNANKINMRLSDIGIQSSKMERVADEAERNVLQMKCCEYMSKYIGQSFDGIVISVSARGLGVQLDNYIEGFVNVRNLPGRYLYSKDDFCLISLDEHDDYRIGDNLLVKLENSDRDNKHIDFSVISKKNHDNKEKILKK